MPTEPVCFSVRLEALPGKESEVLDSLVVLAEMTRLEVGCLRYEPHQSADDPRAFLLYELWQSQEHLDVHSRQPHLKEFQDNMKSCLVQAPKGRAWKALLL